MSKLTKITAYDLETTGFSTTKNQILEVAAVSFDLTTNTFCNFSTLVCVSNIPKKITELSGISNKTLHEEGTVSLSEAMAILKQYLVNSLIVGHNINQFDNRFLRANSELPVDTFQCFDTLEKVRIKSKTQSSRTALRMKKKTSIKVKNDLPSCLVRYGINNPCEFLRTKFPQYSHECDHRCTSHRALYDAHAALALYFKII